ncbi:hypothetical protein [Listeria grandensis]|uniref:hypothetical protein n=1 Tax=Listeria grandensis TaxID=1494963 RepID=UPI00164E1330|nr:hypothetical protein [Listeria grandensis]MBC6314048.1 hypothetical protein [Listeria grandensis]
MKRKYVIGIIAGLVAIGTMVFTLNNPQETTNIKAERQEQVAYANSTKSYEDLLVKSQLSAFTAFGPDDYESVFATSDNIFVGKFIKIVGIGNTKDETNVLKQAKQIAAENPDLVATTSDSKSNRTTSEAEKPTNPEMGEAKLEEKANESSFEKEFYFYTVWEVEIVDSVKGQVGSTNSRIQVIVAGLPTLEVEGQAQVKEGEVYIIPVNNDSRVGGQLVVNSMGTGYEISATKQTLSKEIENNKIIQEFEDLGKKDPKTLEIKEFDTQSEPSGKK